MSASLTSSPSASSATVRATVVICTYNRADRLGACIESLKAQSVPPEAFEIIVVDDGSTDDTEAVCGRFAPLPNVKVIRQPNAGLGAARERGWQAGQGPVIAFLDDDAVAPPDWLHLILSRFDEYRARTDAPVALGGPTRPIWEIPRPVWLTAALAEWLTVWSPYTAYRESATEHLFVGANMAFCRTALAKVGGFSAALGRRGANLLSHEESDLWHRLQDHRFRSAHDPAIWVHHHIPASRMTPMWFRRRIFWEGVSMTRRRRPQKDSRHFLAAVRTFLSAPVAGPVRQHILKPSLWRQDIAWQLHIAYCWGCAREWCRSN